MFKEVLLTRTAKVKLYPTKYQKQILDYYFEELTKVYNMSIDYFSNADRFTTKFTAINEINYSRSKDIHSQTVQGVISKVRDSFVLYWKGYNRKPTLKTNINWIHFTQLTCDPFQIRNKLKIPKIGLISIRTPKFKYPITKYKTLEIVLRKDGNYYAYITYKVRLSDILKVKAKKGEVVGIDLGTKYILVTSDGDMYRLPNNSKYYKRVIELQKILSHKLHVNGNLKSNNIEKLRIKLAKTFSKIINRNTDYIHKLVNKILEDYKYIVVEDLKPIKMVKKAKQDNKYKAKHINKQIHQSSWTKLLRIMEYKAEQHKSIVIKVNPYNTSNRCSVCGTVNKSNRVDRDTYRCNKCGSIIHADINAAINIKDLFMGKWSNKDIIAA